jgi:hypothetical protein
MSSRFKRCKTCGTTNVSDFAPRKSVICKNCEFYPESKQTTTPETLELCSSKDFVSGTEGFKELHSQEGLGPSKDSVSGTEGSKELRSQEELCSSKDSVSGTEGSKVPDFPIKESDKTVSNLSETVILSDNNDSETLKTVSEKQSNDHEKLFETLSQKLVLIESNYKDLKLEIEKLGRLKKMFPRMFPEDNEENVKK